MENQILSRQHDEKFIHVPVKREEKKATEAITLSTIQKLKIRWESFVASLPEMPRLFDRPGYYHNETTNPDAVRQRLNIVKDPPFRY